MAIIRKFVVPSFPVNRFYTKAQVDALIAGVGGASITITDITGTIDGNNVSFTLGATPSNGVILIILGNQPQIEGVDYTRSGTSITYTTAPAEDLSTAAHKAILY